MFFKILWPLVTGLFLIGSFNTLSATEVDSGMVVVDRKPWKISWIQQDEKTWVLLADFDKGELRTYFKQPPPKTGLGLNRTNKPIKQEFEFLVGRSLCQQTANMNNGQMVRKPGLLNLTINSNEAIRLTNLELLR
ncbi:MAG: hypothetical protein HWD61_03090 [Parachlamydiaceae bacterium]|nr:MAG: hypothetical protein HWD61_03090 [Parachlamydiaceae bacterium]